MPGPASPFPLTVLGYGTNSPPGSPNDGDAYVIGSSPTGAWSGHANETAVYGLGRWWFAAVAKGRGQVIFDAGGSRQYGHTGSALFELAKLSDISLTNLSGLTTAGDIVARDGTGPARMAVGAYDGMALRVKSANANKLEWAYDTPVVSFTFNASTATATNAETSGVGNTSTTAAAPVVPSGKTFKILGYLGQIETGTTNGGYDIDVIVRNTTDSTDVVLGSQSSTVAGGVANNLDFNGVGTPDTPLGTVAAGKRFKFGWRNKNTSVAALSGTQKSVTVWGIFV